MTAAAVLVTAHAVAIAQSAPKGVTWSADTVVNQTCLSCNIAHPDMAMHPSGNALAIWSQNDGVPDIQAARFDASTNTWKGFRKLQLGTYTNNYAVDSPKVRIDANGNGVAAWTESGTNSIYAARYRASDTSWSTPLVIHKGTNFYHTSLNMAMDPAGNAFITWVDGTNETVFAKRLDAASGAWSPAMPISGTKKGNGFTAEIGADDYGNALASWVEADNLIYFSRYNKAANQWSTAASTGLATFGGNLFMTVDHWGNGTVVFTTGATNSSGVGSRFTVARYRPSTNAWSAPKVIQTTQGWTIWPDLAADRFGNVFVVWSQAPDYSYTSTYKATAVRYEGATGPWGAPVQINNTDKNDLFFKVMPDANGNAIVVWSKSLNTITTSNETRYFRKAAARYNIATHSWSAVSFGVNDVAESFVSGLGVNAAGNALTIDVQYSGYQYKTENLYGLTSNILKVNP